ncbi:MAG TPA: ABC transporter permease [Actinomycetota bacterium]
MTDAAGPVRETDRGAWALVARRDFWVRLRDRGFVISSAITLAVLVAVIVLRAVGDGDRPTFDLAVVEGGGAAAAVDEAAPSVGVEVRVRRYDGMDAAERALREGEVDAVLSGDTLTGLRDVAVPLQQAVQAAAIGARIDGTLDRYGVPPDEREALADRAPVSVVALAPGDPNRQRNGGIAFVAVILLYGQLFGYGVWVATGVIEEKSSRVVEILLSTVSPWQLMAGKIVGIGALGLAQLTAIAAIAVTLAVGLGVVEIPGDAIGAALLALGWFVLGFAFYAGLFAVAGALVSRMEELQNAMVPLNLVILGSFFVSLEALQDPDATLARIASILPTSSAFAMPVRIVLGSATTVEVLLAVVVVVAAAIATIPLAGRLYSGAVLRTGQRVKLRDAWRSSTAASG